MFDTPQKWTKIDNEMYEFQVNEDNFIVRFEVIGDNRWEFSFGIFPDGYELPNDLTPYMMQGGKQSIKVISTVISIIMSFADLIENRGYIETNVMNNNYNGTVYGRIFKKYTSLYGYTMETKVGTDVTNYTLTIN